MDKDFYSIKEFAAKLGVSAQTIRRALKNGRIRGIRVGSTAHSTFRIPNSEIERMGVFELESIVNRIVDKKIMDRS